MIIFLFYEELSLANLIQSNLDHATLFILVNFNVFSMYCLA